MEDLRASLQKRFTDYTCTEMDLQVTNSVLCQYILN